MEDHDFNPEEASRAVAAMPYRPHLTADEVSDLRVMHAAAKWVIGTGFLLIASIIGIGLTDHFDLRDVAAALVDQKAAVHEMKKTVDDDHFALVLAARIQAVRDRKTDKRNEEVPQDP